MARDYKNTPKPGNKKKAPPVSGWAWLLTGLAIGLFVALLVYLQGRQPESGGITLPPPIVDKGQPAEPKVSPADKDPAAKRPEYTFYDLLPEMEVPVEDREVAAQRDTSEPVIYYLQVASFRRFEEADKLRAQLAFLNLESHIQRVSVTGKDQEEQTWHRVRVGPFDSSREMDRIRTRLREQALDPIILKVKG